MKCWAAIRSCFASISGHFVAEGHDVELLLEAFLATANEIPRDSGQMQTAVALTVAWLQSSGATELAAQLEELEKELRPKGYPAVQPQPLLPAGLPTCLPRRERILLGQTRVVFEVGRS